MKKSIRLLALLLTFCMMFGNAISAYAESNTASEISNVSSESLSGENVQKISSEDSVSSESDDNISSDSEVKKQTIMICKQDTEGNLLSGAELSISSEDGDKVIESITTTSEAPYQTSLLPGTYTLSEQKAPDGYETAEDIRFTVDNDGNLTVHSDTGDEEIADKQITMTDSKKATEEKVNSEQSVNSEVSEEDISPVINTLMLGAASPKDVSSEFHAAITTSDNGSEYVSGSTVNFLIKYKLDYGIINEGDYIYLTVPAALSVGRLSVDPSHFSSATVDHTDSDGNQVYKLIFTATAHEGISGSMTMRVTATNNTTSDITPTVEIGSNSLTITVVPGGSHSDTGTETRAIEKDALGSEGTGMSTGWNSSEGGYSIYDPDKGAVAQYRIYVNLKKTSMTSANVTDYLPLGLTFKDSIEYCWLEDDKSEVDLNSEELAQISFS
jgi:hypothetical protein